MWNDIEAAAGDEHTLVMTLPRELHAKLHSEATEKAIPMDEIVRMELRTRYGAWGSHGGYGSI